MNRYQNAAKELISGIVETLTGLEGMVFDYSAKYLGEKGDVIRKARSSLHISPRGLIENYAFTVLFEPRDEQGNIVRSAGVVDPLDNLEQVDAIYEDYEARLKHDLGIKEAVTGVLSNASKIINKKLKETSRTEEGYKGFLEAVRAFIEPFTVEYSTGDGPKRQISTDYVESRFTVSVSGLFDFAETIMGGLVEDYLRLKGVGENTISNIYAQDLEALEGIMNNLGERLKKARRLGLFRPRGTLLRQELDTETVAKALYYDAARGGP